MITILRNAQHRILVLVWVIMLAGCANAVPPKGGKPDTTPPKVIASEPAQRTLNAHPRYIMLEFNKFIQQRSQVQQNIGITPPVKIDYLWSGAKTIFINLKEPLDSNTTVALTLGTQYSDWDNNKPEASYTLIFSTGNKLDSGTIRGVVETEKPEGLTAFLYQLPSNADTLNPAKSKPKYKTQIGSKKTLEFPALAPGAYRLFVVRDEYRNDLIDKGIDAFGVAREDILLAEGGTIETSVRMIPLEDIQAPRIVDIQLLSRQHLSLRMSEKIHPSSVRKESFILRDSLRLLGENDLPKMLAVYPDANNYALLHCYFDRPLQTSFYRQISTWCIETNGLRDSSGNVLTDSLARVYFAASQETSSRELLPTLVRSQILVEGAVSPFTFPNLRDSSRGLPQKPRIALTFSEALAPSVTLASVRDIAWESASGQAVEFQLSLEQANQLILEPQAMLLPNTWYSLGFRLQSIPLMNSVQMKDSVVVLHFQTDDMREYGGVSGTIADSVRVLPIKSLVGTNATIYSTTNSKTISFSTTGTMINNDVKPAKKAISYIIILETVQGNLTSSAATTPNLASNSSSTPLPTGNTPMSAASTIFLRQRYEIRATSEGRWEFENIPPGAYRISAFADANDNGRYDGGSFFPFIPSERFVQHSTEIQIRPRWTVENVSIILP